MEENPALETREIPTQPKKQVKSWRLTLTTTIAAAVACALCLIPPALMVVFGGGMLAFLSTWLGYATVAILILCIALIPGFYVAKKRSRGGT